MKCGQDFYNHFTKITDAENSIIEAIMYEALKIKRPTADDLKDFKIHIHKGSNYNDQIVFYKALKVGSVRTTYGNPVKIEKL